MRFDERLPSLPARRRLYDIVGGAAALFFVQAAIDLKLPDALEDEPADAAGLAAAVGADPRALARLLRALACHGVFESIGDGRYRHTELSVMLRADAPWGAPDAIGLASSAVPRQVLEHTAEAVRAGHEVFTGMFGSDPTTYFMVEDPPQGAIFNRAMSAHTMLLNNAPALVDALGLAGTERVVDIGGGHGQLLVSLLERHPGLSGVLFDLDSVVGGVDARVRPGGALAGRCDVVTGDCRETVPRGADVYLLKNMLYMFDDDVVVRILRNTVRAAPPGARVVVVDMLLGTGGPFEAVLSEVDMMMLLMGGGSRRTAEEIVTLFHQAGLRYLATRPIDGDQSFLLEGRTP